MMKYIFTIVTICLFIFTSGCTKIKEETSVDKQRIQQLEKNDNYIPWWKR